MLHVALANPLRRAGSKGCLIRNRPQSTSTQLITMALPIGSKAPDFTLKSMTADGLTDIKLSDNGGKTTLLLFFPAAFTSVCTQEMCDMTSGLEAYEKRNARVIAVSVDTPFAQNAWAQKEGIRIPLASDLNKDVAKAYGVLLEDLVGIGSAAKRAAFVIDRDGTIQYSEETPTPKDLPNFGAIGAKLDELK